MLVYYPVALPARNQYIVRLWLILLVALLPHSKFTDVVVFKPAKLAAIEDVEGELSG